MPTCTCKCPNFGHCFSQIQALDLGYEDPFALTSFEASQYRQHRKDAAAK